MQPHELLDQVQRSGLANLNFASPWAARLFGMTLAAAQKKIFSLQDFQQTLIESIKHHERDGCIDNDEQYYTCWLEALQRLLEEHHLIDHQQLGKVETQIMSAAQERHDHQHSGHHHAHHHHKDLERLT